MACSSVGRPSDPPYALQKPHMAFLTLEGLWSGRRSCAASLSPLLGAAAETATSLKRRAVGANKGRSLSESVAWRGSETGRAAIRPRPLEARLCSNHSTHSLCASKEEEEEEED